MLCGKIAHVHMLLLMQAPLQGQPSSQRPATLNADNPSFICSGTC